MKKIKDPTLFEKIRQFLTEYMPIIKRESANTVIAYRYTLNLYLVFLQGLLSKGLNSITSADFNQKNILAFIDWLRSNRGNKVSTANLRLVHMRRFCRFLMGENVLLLSELSAIQKMEEFPKEYADGIKYLTIPEMKLVLAQPDSSKKMGLRDRFFMYLLYDSGCRIQEILDLTIRDFSVNSSGARLHMAPAIRAQITAELGVEPILINSALVSAQSRQRLYWTNIPGVELPEDQGIILLDVLDSGLPLREKGYTLKANYSKASATNTLDGGHFPAPMAIEPVNITADGKAQCLRATYYKDGIRNMVGNTIDRKTCVAQPVCVNSKSGRGGVPGLQPSLADRVYSIEGKGTAVTTAFHPHIAIPMAPIRVGTIESGTGSEGQGHRVYSADGKSKTLCGNGGGAGAKTGLYTVPTDCPALRVAEATAQGYTDILPGECVDLTMPNSKTRRGRAMKEKANCLTTSCQYYQYCGTMDRPIYEVRDGQITINGQQYPIKLMDGYYIIRKLTVRECMRLQTVPEGFVFPVSDTQAYKMLGNGWTVDVIAHILSYCPGITTEPLEVLSMYDGMSCGHLALDKLGANVLRYYATEIDKYAIKTTQTNFPDTVQLGDAFQVREDEWWSFFDL